MKRNLILGIALAFCMFAMAQERVTIKAGTIVPLKSLSEVRGASAKVGQSVDFEVSRNVMDGDNVVIPAGSIAKGKVYEARRSSWWGTKGKLGIKLSHVTLPNGTDVYFTSSDIHIVGKNRTPLTVVLACCAAWPCMFICGSKAVMPTGYEYDARVANDTSVSVQ
ncbi:hypothetical protein EJ73_00574 [Hoylesella shahii DSM 15611 = JCM 12083]|uniref:Uncharacterized protein n=1 Tax=Hoylesella shahii DSM 15611 = JCM 12083 TaxID=1122991 RepID=A0A318HYD3_9BACT|nr:hypothetical protein EJ73_00574 [Hoylesella shahii DSM 15611 = JCM 12083]